jgi:hypothetical protein
MAGIEYQEKAFVYPVSNLGITVIFMSRQTEF